MKGELYEEKKFMVNMTGVLRAKIKSVSAIKGITMNEFIIKAIEDSLWNIEKYNID